MRDEEAAGRQRRFEAWHGLPLMCALERLRLYACAFSVLGMRVPNKKEDDAALLGEPLPCSS